MRNPDRETTFLFKQFAVVNHRSAMKVGTDGVLLGAWAFAGVASDAPLRILDAGCGTGLLALMLAQRFSRASITAIDIDADAAHEAAMNFARSPWSDRLTALHADFAVFMQDSSLSFDLIICNPPYFTGGITAPDTRRSTARHQEGLTYHSLLAGARKLLKPQGSLAIVVPTDAYAEISVNAVARHLFPARCCQVVTVEGKAPKRFLLEYMQPGTDDSPQPCVDSPETVTLALHHSNGLPTEQYIALTGDFYLRIH